MEHPDHPAAGTPAARGHRAFAVFALSSGALLAVACTPGEVPLPPPPQTRVEAVADTYHGVEVADPYRWLEEDDSAETRAWIDAQNAYTDAVLDRLPGRQALADRFAALLKTEVVTQPTVRGDRYFFKRRSAGQDLFVIAMRRGPGGEDEVLVDPHPLSPDHTTSVDLMDVSDDGRLLAFAVREGGEDEVTVRLLDVDAGADLPDVLPRDLYFGVDVTADASGLYYTRQTEAGPRVFHHLLGGDVAADRQVFGDGYGPEKILVSSLSDDGRYLLVHVLHGAAADRTEIHLRDLAAGSPWVAAVAEPEARFFGEVAGDRLYVQTNWQAPGGRVLAVDLAAPGDRQAWVEVVPEREGAVIETVALAGGRIFVNYLEDVQSRVVVYGPDGAALGEIAFDSLGTVSAMAGEWDRDEAFFAFSSFAVPRTLYRYEVSSGRRQVWHRPDVPVEPEAFAVEQVWLTSKDGTRVPMFLVRARDAEPDGERPVLLTGYGGFTASLTPAFRSSAVVWAEHGGVFAVANLRGGGEFGEAWHQAGMRESKQNVFDDFIAAAEWLIDEGYTRPGRLAIRGGSNGGLLVAATMVQRPDLFGAVICTYPLLDMLRYQEFLMGPYWVPEYGSAEESPEMFEVLRAYSPYHNVEPGADYPPVLFVTGDADTRVAPLHARKMTALMQAAVDGAGPVLLRYHTKAGHSGGQPVSEQIEDSAEAFSFLFWRLGVEG